MRVHVGTMGWSYGFWKGSFYPEGLASKEFLAYYGKQFSTVEVDSTFTAFPVSKAFWTGKSKLLKASCFR